MINAMAVLPDHLHTLWLLPGMMPISLLAGDSLQPGITRLCSITRYWPYSSIDRSIQKGIIQPDWAVTVDFDYCFGEL